MIIRSARIYRCPCPSNTYKASAINLFEQDESDELGEGDFREVAFADGSPMKPRATGGNGLPQVGGWRMRSR